MSYCELSQFISGLACAIAQDKTAEELAVLSAIFTQLGDTLTTLALGKAID